MKRARQTCEIIIDYKCDIFYDDRIIERDFGEFEGFKKTEFDYEGIWNSLKKQTFIKAETVLNFEKRIFSLLDEINSKYKEKNILIVSHGGVGTIITCFFNGKPQNGDYLQFLVNTGDVQIFEN